MSYRFVVALLALLGSACACHGALAADYEIAYAEGINLPSAAAGTGAQKLHPTGPVEFSAFNRKFRLELSSNESLLRLLPANTRVKLAAMSLLQGTVENAPGSWVRLSIVNGRYQGALWDGAELYAIEPTERIAPVLATPLLRASTHAMYRVSDSRGGLGEKSCAAIATPIGTEALPSYKGMFAELQSISAAVAGKEIEVALIADYEFTVAHGAATVADMASRINIVDGIFANQVGVSIVPTDFVTYGSSADPFTRSNASALLEEVSEYRQATPAIRSRGLAHLFTGRELDGNTVGVAFVGALCRADKGVSLSETSAFVDSALIIAHELGHNFGAPHDGQSGSACSATSPFFLMAPTMNGSATFSACSVQRMQPQIAAASCVRNVRLRDTAVQIAAEQLEVPLGQAFELMATVSSLGEAASTNIVANTSLNSYFDVLAASVDNGECWNNESQVSCQIEQLQPGQSAQMRLTLSPRYLSDHYPLGVHVQSTNDSNSSNDSDTLALKIISGVAVDLSVTPQPLQVDVNEESEFAVNVASSGIRGLADGQVSGSTGGALITGVTINAGSCSYQNIYFSCSLGALAASEARVIRVQFAASRAGRHYGTVYFASRDSSVSLSRNQPFEILARPVRDIGIVLDPSSQLLTIGDSVETQAVITSNGSQTVEDVRIRVLRSPWLSSELALPLDIDCVDNGSYWSCGLGDMAAGDSKVIRIITRADVPASDAVNVLVEWPSPDDDPENDWVASAIEARYRNDAQVIASSDVFAYDLRESLFTAAIGSVGTEAAGNVVIQTTLPDGFSILGADLESEACVVEGQVVSCSLAVLPANENALLSIRYRAGSPGTYSAKILLSADADGDTTNNEQDVTFHIQPDVNGSLRVAPAPEAVFVDDVITLEYEVVSNRYVLPGARLVLWMLGFQFESSTPGINCQVSHAGLSCDLGDLPANQTRNLAIRLRATYAGQHEIFSQLYSVADTDQDDNYQRPSVRVHHRGDASLTVHRTQLGTPIVNQTVRVPYRVIADGILESPSVHFEVNATSISELRVSGGVNCAWSEPPYECDVWVPQGEAVEFALSFVPGVAGPITITARVSALNDVNSANDSQRVELVANAEQPESPNPAPSPNPVPTPAPKGGGGGGGAGYPFLTALLGLVLAVRMRRSGALRFP